MLKVLKSIIDINEQNLKKLTKEVAKINFLEASVEKLSDDELRGKTKAWQQELQSLESEASSRKLEAIMPEAFAVVREAFKRTVGERTWDEQLIGAVALHKGMAAELKTGEGKTHTAVLPLYLNALAGKGAHLVTVNDYLARVQAEGMAVVFNFLGLTVGCINQEGKSYLIDANKKQEKEYTHYSQADGSNLINVTRREAYAAHVTYGTNNEFGFDYLRDNLAYSFQQTTQTNPNGEFGAHNFVIVDEIDSILIDEARTPLIISSQAGDASQRYSQVAQLIKNLVRNTDYEIDEKHKSATLTELGIRKLERMFNIDHLYEKDFQLVHLVEQSLKAHALFNKNKDYIVQNNEVIIVDEFTGRLMPGRRYSDGLHQAIEAKEAVPIQKESKTVATISFQNYFRMYEKLSGMSGTVITEVEEFRKIYNLASVAVPTHEPVIRKDKSDLVYKTEAGKWRAVVSEIKARSENGQPVLVGTTSVEKNELLHTYLQRLKVPHQILNAKHHETEGKIIAEAGRLGAVTIATNMAGRGVDIILGGTKPIDKNALEEWKKHHNQVLELGGLYVIGTDRHESRRIDNQLRGRAGRHGEPGESRFFVSLQDDLMRVFGGDTIARVMNRMGLDENTPIEAKLVSKSIEQAQKRVEGYNFDARKYVVDFDDVMDQQRKIIYSVRRRLLELASYSSSESRRSFSEGGRVEKLSVIPAQAGIQSSLLWVKSQLTKYALPEEAWDTKVAQVGPQVWGMVLLQMALPVIDTLWMEHLTTMDDMREGAGLQAYGQKDPLVIYRQEGRVLFERLIGQIWSTVVERVEKVEIKQGAPTEAVSPVYPSSDESKGRGIEKPEAVKGSRLGSTLARTVNSDGFSSSPSQSSGLTGVEKPGVDLSSLQYKHSSPDAGVADEIAAMQKANGQGLIAKGLPQGLNLSRGKSTPKTTGTIVNTEKVGRNDPCPCGSGKKYKKCHGK